jgi:hypothetical protein
MSEAPPAPAQCPFCGSHQVKAFMMDYRVEISGILYDLSGISTSLCRKCNNEFETPRQIERNTAIYRNCMERADRQ